MVRVLIADDEKLECDALEKMIQNHFADIELLPSVYDGLSLVDGVKKFRPDITIADINMPGLTGLDALELLRTGNPDMEILIHTAYSNFEYIHRALKLGATDYLVKPVFEENFLEVFRPILQNVEKRKENEQKKAEKNLAGDLRNATERNIMMGLLLGRSDEKEWNLYLEKYAEKSYGRQDGSTHWTGGYILSVYFQPCINREMYYASLAQELKRHYRMLYIISKDILYCLIMGMNNSELPGMVRRFSLNRDIIFKAGLSSVKQKYKEFLTALGEVEIARQSASENECVYYKAAEIHLRPDHFSDLGEEIARLLSGKDTAAAGQIVREKVVAAYPDGNVSFADFFFAQRMISKVATALKMDVRRTGTCWTLPALLARLAGSDETSGVWGRDNSDDRLSQMMDAETLVTLLTKELRQLECDIEKPIRKENAYISQALHFIHQHYMEELSLEQVADTVGISQFYLSRLLKQERNETFLEIITQERLNASLQYMLDPTRSVQSICEAVGYSVKYFYQIFRNVTGFSQKEFRDSLYGKFS